MTIVRRGWKHQVITILGQSSRGVLVNVYRELAAHRRSNGSGWEIVHVPTGLVMVERPPRVFASELAAMGLIENMYVAHQEWGDFFGQPGIRSVFRMLHDAAPVEFFLCTYPTCKCEMVSFGCPKRYHKTPLD